MPLRRRRPGRRVGRHRLRPAAPRPRVPGRVHARAAVAAQVLLHRPLRGQAGGAGGHVRQRAARGRRVRRLPRVRQGQGADLRRQLQRPRLVPFFGGGSRGRAGAAVLPVRAQTAAASVEFYPENQLTMVTGGVRNSSANIADLLFLLPKFCSFYTP